MKNILDWIEENKQQFEGQEPRNMKLARVDDIPDAFNPDLEQSEFLKPGETLEDWKPNPFLKPHADGGRAGYNDGQLVTPNVDGSRPGYNGKKTMVEQAKELGVSKSALKKPYPPEIEKRIIQLATQKNPLGAEAIAKKLREEFDGVFGRSSVGKRIAALRKEGVIKNIPVSERQASIDQRGDFYKKPAGDKYLVVREVRDIDRTTKWKDTGELKYNIPEDAKFKIDFKNPGVSGAAVSDIPEDLRGIQYFKTKKDAEKALKKRKALKLKADVDLDVARRSANKKKYDLVKEVSNNNIEELLTDFKKGQPLEQAHRLSLNQVKKTGELYNVMNLGLDFDDPNFVQINNEFVKPYENKLKQLYKEQDQLYKKASKLETIPKELQKKIELNNKKISTVVDLSGGRVQGLQLDELTLKPKTYGTNYANVLGFGMYDKPVKDLTKIERAEIGAIMQGQIENEKRTAGATAKKLFANTELLNNLDDLTAQTAKIQQLIKKKGLNITNKEAGFIAIDMLKDFGKLGLKGGRLLKMLELQYEPIFEGLFYQYARKYKGYDHDLAREELFLPKILAKYFPGLSKLPFTGDLFKPYEAGVWEGADPLIEKELYEIRGENEFIDVDKWNRPPMQDPEFGKVIGERSQVKKYIDAQKTSQKEVDKYYKLENELDMMQVGSGDYTAASPEEIKAKKKEIEDQRNLLIDLEHTLKPGTPAHEAYMIAKEKQDYEFGKNISESDKRKEMRRHKEYLEYKGGKQRSFLLPKEEGKKRVEDPLFKKPYTFLETDDTFFDILEPGKKAWEEYGLTDTQVGPVIKEGIKDKWEQIYGMGGIDLMDKIGIAGGYSKLAGGGMVGIRKPSAIAPTGGPQSGGLPSLYNNVRKR